MTEAARDVSEARVRGQAVTSPRDPAHDAINQILEAPEFRRLEDLFDRSQSALTVLRVNRREACHTAALRWLLTPTEIHGLGPIALKRFLSLAASIGRDPQALQTADLERLDLASAKVKTEHWIRVNDKDRRLDLVAFHDVERPFLLVETKIDSAEGDKQTSDYAEWARSRTVPLANATPHRPVTAPLLVFLGPAALPAPARPFVHLTFERYVEWISEFVPLVRAEHRGLVEGVRDAIRLRDDVSDPEVERLVVELERRVGTAILSLQTLVKSIDVSPSHSAVLERHKALFRRLGIYSRDLPLAFRRRLLAAFTQGLSPAFWRQGLSPLLTSVFNPESDQHYRVEVLVSGCRRPNEVVTVGVGVHTYLSWRAGRGDASPARDKRRISALEWHRTVVASIRDAIRETHAGEFDKRGTGREYTRLLERPLKPPSVLVDTPGAFVQSEIDAAVDWIRELEAPLTNWARDVLPSLTRRHQATYHTQKG